jgi:hypothetical protein
MSIENRNINGFITMINRTEFKKCNDYFFNNLEFSKKENTVDKLISEWNKCSSKEIIEKFNSPKNNYNK